MSTQAITSRTEDYPKWYTDIVQRKANHANS
jgi:hypothetical protein